MSMRDPNRVGTDRYRRRRKLYRKGQPLGLGRVFQVWADEGLGLGLQRFLGGHGRENLSYLVVPVTKAQEAQRIVELLKHELRDGGAAVVFCATRKTAQTMSELVTAAVTVCGCFHGGLEPEIKKSVQQRFTKQHLRAFDLAGGCFTLSSQLLQHRSLIRLEHQSRALGSPRHEHLH